MLTLKKRSLLIVAAMASLVACSPSDKTSTNNQGQNSSSDNQASNVDIGKISEALGHFIGRNLNTPEVKFDIDKVIKGIREGATGKPAPMTDQEYEKAMTQLQQQTLNNLSTKNLDAANAFMKDNASTKGLVELVPGKVTYIVLEEGKGPAVPEHGTPQINYTGKYIDGTVFGSSDASGGPITVPVDQTIPGFSKGIVGMKEGEKRRIFVHPDMGYGTNGQLPPNSLLVFDVEVVKATSPDKELNEMFQSKMSDDLDQGTDKERGLDFDEQQAPKQNLKN